MTADDAERVTLEHRDGIMLIGLNRPAKKNAFDQAMVDALSVAYSTLEDNHRARCGLLFAHGDDFTAGLDLPYFADRWAAGEDPFLPRDDQVDPLGLKGRERTKPVVAAVHGRCYTLGIELLLAADVRVAAPDTTFLQLEVLHGIFPAGGATVRLVREVGWGNAMRWMLTGDPFDAAEALRIGLVQEVVAQGSHVDAAFEIASRIAAAAPLGVAAARASAATSLREGETAALASLIPTLRPLLASDDAAEAIAAFHERRQPVFSGH